MPRIRTIKPEFWSDEKLRELPMETRILAAAILNIADDDGYLIEDQNVIKDMVFRYDDVFVGCLLDQLYSVRYIDRGFNKVGRLVIRVRNFLKHQRINRPTPSNIKTKLRLLPMLPPRERFVMAQEHGCRRREHVKVSCCVCRKMGTLTCDESGLVSSSLILCNLQAGMSATAKNIALCADCLLRDYSGVLTEETRLLTEESTKLTEKTKKLTEKENKFTKPIRPHKSLTEESRLLTEESPKLSEKTQKLTESGSEHKKTLNSLSFPENSLSNRDSSLNALGGISEFGPRELIHKEQFKQESVTVGKKEKPELTSSEKFSLRKFSEEKDPEENGNGNGASALAAPPPLLVETEWIKVKLGQYGNRVEQMHAMLIPSEPRFTLRALSSFWGELMQSKMPTTIALGFIRSRFDKHSVKDPVHKKTHDEMLADVEKFYAALKRGDEEQIVGTHWMRLCLSRWTEQLIADGKVTKAEVEAFGRD